MINRIDGSAFDDDHIWMMVASNVICGMALDDAKLYATALELTRWLRSFLEISSALNKTKRAHNVIGEILTHAMITIHASRALSFCLTSGGGFPLFVHPRNECVHGHFFANLRITARKRMPFLKKEVMRKLGNASVGSGRDCWSDTVCGFPLFNGRCQPLGVMEFGCTLPILPEGFRLLDCFAVFAIVSLARGEFQEFASVGEVERELKQWVTDVKRPTVVMPQLLVIPPSDERNLPRRE
jgi:hypothetical protein